MKRSPSAAVFLSLLPGLGHIYVGQVAKGFLLGVSFILTIQMTEASGGPFGILIPFILLYAMVDAHRAAMEVNRIVASGGTPPKGADFGLTKWWGYILIGLGVLFTLDNFDVIDFEWIGRLWPLGLIAIGIYILRRPPSPETPAAPPVPEPALPPAQEQVAAEEHENV